MHSNFACSFRAVAVQGSQEHGGLLALLLSGLNLDGLRIDSAADISDWQPWTASLMAMSQQGPQRLLYWLLAAPAARGFVARLVRQPAARSAGLTESGNCLPCAGSEVGLQCTDAEQHHT